MGTGNSIAETVPRNNATGRRPRKLTSISRSASISPIALDRVSYVKSAEDQSCILTLLRMEPIKDMLASQTSDPGLELLKMSKLPKEEAKGALA